MKGFLSALCLAATLVGLEIPAYGQPVVQSVVDSASFNGVVSPGSLATIKGTNLALVMEPVLAGPLLPVSLSGVSVKIDNLDAPLLYVSPTQLNIQIPYEVSLPGAFRYVPVVVTTPAGASAPFKFLLQPVSPGIFTHTSDGLGKAWVFNTKFASLDVVDGQSELVLYVGGLGVTDPPATTGAGGASAEPYNRVPGGLEVYVGDQQARVDFAGLAPGLPGVYQLNVFPNGPVTDRVYIRLNGMQSNITSVGINPGQNVANASGAIYGLYPPTDPGAVPFSIPGLSGSVSFSNVLHAGAFMASFDILPSAGPFSIAAVSDAATSIVQFDPVKGTFQGVSTVPTAPSRSWDFYNTEIPQIIDFKSCVFSPSGARTCNPFPGNIIPMSRVDQSAAAALLLLPPPNTFAPAITIGTVDRSVGTFEASGAAHSGSTFVIDANNNPSLRFFGGYLFVPPPDSTQADQQRTAHFALYVDGKLVVSKSVQYPAGQ